MGGSGLSKTSMGPFYTQVNMSTRFGCGWVPLGPTNPRPAHSAAGPSTLLGPTISRARRGMRRVGAREVHGLAAITDPAAEREAIGLIPSHPTLRPADILTTATVSGRSTAFDVSITSPDCGTAGDDCCQSMYEHKQAKYAPHLNELERNGIDYIPIVWSAYGRPHEAAVAAIRTMARRTARRRGHQDATTIENRTMHNIAVEIWRRNVDMIRYCWSGGSSGPDMDV